MFNSNAGTLPVSIPIGVGNNGGFGGNTFDDIIALAIVGMIFGWGGYGGFGGYGAGGVQENYILTSDMSQLSRQMDSGFASQERRTDSIINGICTLGYDSLSQSNSINTNVMQGVNTLQGAIKDCCCQTQQNVADLKYTVGATGADLGRAMERGFADTGYVLSDKFCQTNFNAERNTRSIVDAQNASTQAILAKLDAMENSRKDEKIAEQACVINNQYLLSQINKTPVPAYVVQNPYCNCNTFGYGTTIA